MIFYFLIIFISTASIYAQNLPLSYHLEKKNFSKTLSSTPLSNGVDDIIITDNTIWLGTSRGLSASSDDGETWKNYFETPDFGTEIISALAYKNGVIWAATFHFEQINGESVQVGTGLHFSSDGENWTNIPQPVDDPGDSLITYGINTIRALPVTVDKKNLTFDIALTDDAVWITSWAGGLRKSFDNGSTWQRVVLPPDFLNSIKPTDTLNFALQNAAGNFGPEQYNNHLLFSVLAVDNNTIYAGSAGGLNKSIDGGVSWQRFSHLNQNQPISGNWVIGLGYNQFDNSIWADSWQADGQSEFNAISASFDGGLNWKTFLPDRKGNNIGFRYYKDGNGNIISADVIIPTRDGLFRSSDNGNTWIRATGIVDDQTDFKLNTEFFNAAASKNITSNEADIWIGSNDGTIKFSDSGNMWEGMWKIFLASQDLAGENSAFAFPNPFAPGLDILKIKYKTGNSSSKVTIRILDFDMNLVKTVIQNAPRSSNADVVDNWNGTDEFGNYVPNGVYFYRIDLESGNPIYGKIIAVK